VIMKWVKVIFKILQSVSEKSKLPNEKILPIADQRAIAAKNAYNSFEK